jgi:8-oxo-dGTP pyrophosphatase MutT (NUDIX family)
MESVRVFNGSAFVAFTEAQDGATTDGYAQALARRLVEAEPTVAACIDQTISPKLGLRAAIAAFKKQFTPVDAAGGVILAPDDRLLLIHRNGSWDLPKGKLEKGESATDGALREVTEEVGLTELHLGATLPATYHVYPHNGDWLIKTTHWFEMTASGLLDLTLQTEEGIDDAEWVPVEAVLTRQPIHPSLLHLLDGYVAVRRSA